MRKSVASIPRQAVPEQKEQSTVALLSSKYIQVAHSSALLCLCANARYASQLRKIYE